MRIVAFDTETFLIEPGVLAPRLVCLSVAEAGQPVRLYKTPEAEVKFKELINDGSTILVGHNVAFDMAVCGNATNDFGAIFSAYDAGRIRDTKIREELLDIAAGRINAQGGQLLVKRGNTFEKAAYSLADLERRHLGIDRGNEKTNPDAWRFNYSSLVDIPLSDWPIAARRYAEEDASNTLGVYCAQGGSVADELEQTYAAFALHMISVHGIRVDSKATQELKSRLLVLQERNRRRLIKAGFIKPAKLTPAQIRDGATVELQVAGLPHYYKKDMAAIKAYTNRVYAKRGLRSPVTPKGGIATDKDSLMQSGSRLLALLSEEGGVEKILNTYVPVLEKGSVARINGRYNVLVNSGRCSASQPNLQNIPSGRRVGGVRECFIPTDNYYYCSVDYDTLELRALAQVCLWLFSESAMAQALNAGEDLHLSVAAQLLGISYDDAFTSYQNGNTQTKAARDVAKVANFGFPGGLGIEKFVMFARKSYGVKVDVETARKVKQAWWNAWPEMRQYHRYIDQATRTGPATIKQLGSERVRGHCSFTEAANTLFQGLAGTGAKHALTKVLRECYVGGGALFGSRPVAFVHDECIVEVPIAVAHEAAHRLAEVMVQGMQEKIPDVKITAKPVLMLRWSKEAKPFYVCGRLFPYDLGR